MGSAAAMNLFRTVHATAATPSCPLQIRLHYSIDEQASLTVIQFSILYAPNHHLRCPSLTNTPGYI